MAREVVYHGQTRSGDNAPYALFVNNGHHTRSGSFVRGQFYANRALDIIRSKAQRIAKEETDFRRSANR